MSSLTMDSGPLVLRGDRTMVGGKLTGLTRGPALTDEEKRDLRAFHLAHDPFREIRADMPMQYVTTLLLVALNEGRGVNYYAREAGVSKSVMSRHLHDVGDADRMGKVGYGLVEHRPHPTQLRNVEIYLTPKGRAFMLKVRRAMQLRSGLL